MLATQMPPFTICYVKDSGDYKPDGSFFLVRDFCEKNGLPIYSRNFDSMKYHEDCHYVVSLPAFHLYEKNICRKTFLPTEDLIRKIYGEIDKWKMEEAMRIQKAAARAAKWAKVRAFFSLPSSHKKSQPKV